jgi:hypothetical protein
MPTTYGDPVLTSDMRDIHDLPLDVEIVIDDVEYARVMRSIGVVEDGTPVSAFNSSI